MSPLDAYSVPCRVSGRWGFSVEVLLGGEDGLVDAGQQLWTYDASCGGEVRAKIEVSVLRRGVLMADGFDISYQGEVFLDEDANEVCTLSVTGDLDGSGRVMRIEGTYCERPIDTLDFELFTPPISWEQ